MPSKYGRRRGRIQRHRNKRNQKHRNMHNQKHIKDIKVTKEYQRAVPTTPLCYEPIVLSEKTIQMVNDHIDTFFGYIHDVKGTAYDQETTKFCFLPINDQSYAIYYRPDATSEWSEDNCEEALVGFTTRCNGANEYGFCHYCAHTLARCIVDSKIRSRVYYSTPECVANRK
jgi:hypothetical protein